MYKTFITTAFAAFACAAVIGAQAPPPASQAPSPGSQTPAPTPVAPAAQTQAPRAPEASSADSFTITGCVQRRAQSQSATPGAVGTAGAAGEAFILTNAMRPAGSAAAGAAAPAASTYRLDAEASKLSSHVGQKVEITGSMADRAASAGSSSNAPGAPASPGAAGAPGSPGASNAPAAANADAPRLKVQSVKMIASSCAG